MVTHQCEVCKKEFKGKSSLEMHFRTHSGRMTPPVKSHFLTYSSYVEFGPVNFFKCFVMQLT